MGGIRVRKAVIPAAGLGTRFLPATKAIPKEMLPIVDVPTIQLVVEEAVNAGIEAIVIINGRGKFEIEDHFDHAFELEHTLRERGKADILSQVTRISQMVRLISVRQKAPLGLGHAILCAREAIGDEPFAVLLGDDLFDAQDARPGIAQLIDVYHETGGSVLGVQEVAPGREHMYGIVAGSPVASKTRGVLRVTEMVEKPKRGTAPSRLAIIGRYVLTPEVWEPLSQAKASVGGEIQLIDGLQSLMANGNPGVFAKVLEGTRHDAGDREGYLRANLAYALQRPELRDAVVAMCQEIVDRAREG